MSSKRNITKTSIMRDVDALISEKDSKISSLKLEVRNYQRVLGDFDLNSDSIALKIAKMEESIEQYKRHENLQSGLIEGISKARAKLYEKMERLTIENRELKKRLKNQKKPQNQPDE